MKRYSCFLKAFFLLLSICSLSGCITRAKQRSQTPASSPTQHTKANVTGKRILLVEGLKSDAAALSKVLKQVQSTEAQDLAILTEGLKQSENKDIEAFLKSQYIDAIVREQILKKDQLAGAVLIGLGLTTAAISTGLLTRTPIRKKLWSSLGFGVAGIVIGSRLFVSPNEKNRKQAEALGLSSAAIIGIFSISTIVTSSIALNASSPKVLDDLAKILPKSSPKLQSNLRKNGLHHSADFLLLVKNRAAIHQLYTVLAAKKTRSNRPTYKAKLSEILQLATTSPSTRKQQINSILANATNQLTPEALQKAQIAAESLKTNPLEDFRKAHGNPAWTFAKNYQARGIQKIAANTGLLILALGMVVSSSASFGLTSESQNQIDTILTRMSLKVSEFRSLSKQQKS